MFYRQLEQVKHEDRFGDSHRSIYTCGTRMPVADRTALLNPPLKWAGGKRWQVPHLQPLWKPHARRRLVEPFCGGLAVALGLLPTRAVLNDANPHVIGFFIAGCSAASPSICRWKTGERLFYQHRFRFNALLMSDRLNARRPALSTI